MEYVKSVKSVDDLDNIIALGWQKRDLTGLTANRL